MRLGFLVVVVVAMAGCADNGPCFGPVPGTGIGYENQYPGAVRFVETFRDDFPPFNPSYEVEDVMQEGGTGAVSWACGDDREYTEYTAQAFDVESGLLLSELRLAPMACTDYRFTIEEDGEITWRYNCDDGAPWWWHPAAKWTAILFLVVGGIAGIIALDRRWRR